MTEQQTQGQPIFSYHSCNKKCPYYELFRDGWEEEQYPKCVLEFKNGERLSFGFRTDYCENTFGGAS